MSSKISQAEYAAIMTEIGRGKALNTSEFIRQAIREKIQRTEA